MELPTGYRMRRPCVRDAPAVTAVVAAHDLADFGEQDYTEDDLLDDWRRPRFDLDRDAWVVVGPTGRLVGYAWVWDAESGVEIDADAFVLPEYAGRGLGGRLFDLIEGRAGELAVSSGSGLVRLGMYAPSVNDAKRKLLLNRGFRPVRSMLRMKIDLSRHKPAEPEVPSGVELRPFRPADDEAIVRAVMGELFSSHSRFTPHRLDEWLELRLRHPAYDPELWRVACAGGEVIGAILVYDVGETGYVTNVGVRAAWRGRGVGLALLSEAFRVLRDRGQMRIVLGVEPEHAPQAVRFYERAGMRVAEQHDWFTKELAAEESRGR